MKKFCNPIFLGAIFFVVYICSLSAYRYFAVSILHTEHPSFVPAIFISILIFYILFFKKLSQYSKKELLNIFEYFSLFYLLFFFGIALIIIPSLNENVSPIIPFIDLIVKLLMILLGYYFLLIWVPGLSKKRSMRCSNKGMVGELSKLAILLAALMLFSLMLYFHIDSNRILAAHEAMELSRDLGRVIDETASSTNFLRVKYELPQSILGESYEVRIKEKEVTVELKGKYAGLNYTTPFLSNALTNNSKFVPGYVLNIEKNLLYDNFLFIS
ncbi:MAG: hypothetical protein QW802_03475 [Candidatus Altiarchaeota archaeon]